MTVHDKSNHVLIFDFNAVETKVCTLLHPNPLDFFKADKFISGEYLVIIYWNLFGKASLRKVYE